MTITTWRCSYCGSMNTHNDNAATRVEISDRADHALIKGDYRLGQIFERRKQVQCINEDGLVERVCFYAPHIENGTVVVTGGERLFFYR